jgi:homoserine dehydrogenase
MSGKEIGVGIIGAGTVGGGVVKILRDKAEMLESRTGCKLNIVKVANRSTGKLDALGLTAPVATTDIDEVINDENVDIIVELIGGTEKAYDIVEKSLNAGKPVVTANKALLAERGTPLFNIAKENNTPLGFEAAVAGAIPIIRSIRDGLVGDYLQNLLGIVNGTCNYILTQMMEKGQAYGDALKDAQELGFAEADPTFDVEGFDSAHKLAILSSLGFGTNVEFPKMHVEGISKLTLSDINIAQELGYAIKLLAVARPDNGKLFLSVHPSLLTKEHPMATVSGSMNAVSLFADAAQEAMFYGRGAGEMPTASAVVSDIVEIARNMLCGCASLRWAPFDKNKFEVGQMDDYNCRYFVRFSVKEDFGVFGTIATILGKHKVSIASALQKEKSDDIIPIVMVTHTAREGDLKAAISEIDNLKFVSEKTGILRIES